MQWIKNNVVGLFGLVFVVGGSLGTLYVKSAINTKVNDQLSGSVTNLTAAHAHQATTLHGQVTRLTRLEGKIENFSRSNDRLILALDKLDVVYGSMRVVGAVQDERIRQLTVKIDKIDSTLKEKHYED